ncbi:hypothetical protein ALC62_08465 [Cyphomyrmex costatus]|uniref:Uncharacterized protein n=1 Tax=Cyphomyrmex costatus TaxID=456900 RepID=A0A195CK09_9HYME|nr:hypothetical protein ALC62_08465 [Cyphomyrmex costatus]
MCDLISRCRGTMVPASVSARRSTPASRDPALCPSCTRGSDEVERVGNALRGTISRKILSCSSAIDFVSHQRKKGGLPIGLIAPTEHCGHFTDSPNIQWGFTDLTLAVKAGGLRIEHSSSAVGSLAD